MINWIYAGLLMLSLVSSLITNSGQALGAAVLEGARAGAALALSMAGPLLLWSGLGKLMDRSGLTAGLARILRPLTRRLFPSTEQDPVLAADLSANLCANLLGLGNAATPRGIRAAKRLRRGTDAGDELCRLVVLNTASIQLIPTNVAAIRSSLGCRTPFDLLPAVWITSLCSAGAGLLAAVFLGRLLKS